MTAIPYSTVRSHLLLAGVTLRTNYSGNSSQILRQSFKSSTPPPFGYCYLEGRLQKDPREYPTLQIIIGQWQMGCNPTDITKYLNAKKIKTRSGKQWKQPTVYNIVQRLKKDIHSSKNKSTKGSSL